MFQLIDDGMISLVFEEAPTSSLALIRIPFIFSLLLSRDQPKLPKYFRKLHLGLSTHVPPHLRASKLPPTALPTFVPDEKYSLEK